MENKTVEGVIEGAGKPTKGLKELPLATAARSMALAPEHGFELKIGDCDVTFVPNAELFSGGWNARTMMQGPMAAGVIVNCLKETWYVESEPTGEDSCGLTIFAPQKGKTGWRSRKPIYTGSARIVRTARGGETLEFDMKTVYPRVHTSPREDSASVSGSATGSSSGTSWMVKGEYKVTF